MLVPPCGHICTDHKIRAMKTVNCLRVVKHQPGTRATGCIVGYLPTELTTTEASLREWDGVHIMADEVVDYKFDAGGG